jgi:hypothetical protein
MRTVLCILLLSPTLALADAGDPADNAILDASAYQGTPSGPMEGAPAAPAQITPVSPPDAVTVGPKSDCKARLKQYWDSQACFAPYKTINGGFKPGAFEHCKVVKYPIDCPVE